MNSKIKTACVIAGLILAVSVSIQAFATHYYTHITLPAAVEQAIFCVQNTLGSTIDTLKTMMKCDGKVEEYIARQFTIDHNEIIQRLDTIEQKLDNLTALHP